MDQSQTYRKLLLCALAAYIAVSAFCNALEVDSGARSKVVDPMLAVIAKPALAILFAIFAESCSQSELESPS